MKEQTVDFEKGFIGWERSAEEVLTVQEDPPET